jgi:hypothetical protein
MACLGHLHLTSARHNARFDPVLAPDCRASAMMRSFVRRMRCWTLVVLAWGFVYYVACSGAAWGHEGQRRDWSSHPAIVELDTTEDIIALGDIHGDYNRLTKLLFAGRLLDAVPDSPKQAVWSGGKSLLVCTGDLIDKWHHGFEIIELLRALQISAERQGGYLIVTVGPHEARSSAAMRTAKATSRETLRAQPASGRQWPAPRSGDRRRGPRVLCHQIADSAAKIKLKIANALSAMCSLRHPPISDVRL